MGVDKHMFDGLFTAMLIMGAAIGVALCGLAWFLVWLFSHIHWSWA